MTNFLNNLEFWKMVLNVLQVLGLAAIGAWAAREKMRWEGRTKKWEGMTQQAVDATTRTQELVEENTAITRNIQKQTDGVTEKLVKLTSKSSYAAGHLRGRADQKEQAEQDELDRVESKFLRKEADALKKKEEDG